MKHLTIHQHPIANTRLDVIDALRGIALFGILLLHNLLHFNLYYIPTNQPEWLILLDKCVMYSVSFCISGKAYAVFSLLFGFSFYIQLRNRNLQGHSFTWRFAWRMFLLILFAEFNAFFYSGNILLMYAVVGLILIPFSKLSNRIILTTAIICLLQPLEITKIAYSFVNPRTDFSYLYLDYSVNSVMMNGSLMDALKTNITDGQICNMLYYIEKGRLFQTIGFFLLGMLFGRLNLFIKTPQSTYVWKRIVAYSTVAFLFFFIVGKVIIGLNAISDIKNSIETVFTSLSNFSFSLILVSIFILLWFHKNNEGYSLQRLIIPYGRMSLTNYISQSIIGGFIYYGFGLGMYKYSGATMSIVIGFLIFLFQFSFSSWWLRHHKQGMLEYLWKKGTWILAKSNSK